jgi:hypothetical protein
MIIKFDRKNKLKEGVKVAITKKKDLKQNKYHSRQRGSDLKDKKMEEGGIKKQF